MKGSSLYAMLKNGRLSMDLHRRKEDLHFVTFQKKDQYNFTMIAKLHTSGDIGLLDEGQVKIRDNI
jgi:hypothetical protein